MNINEIDFQTGDLLLFHEVGHCLSSLIEYFTKSKYSHCAIILKDPTFIDESYKGIYIIESGIESTPDVVDHKRKFGVQIQKLSDAINYYKGDVYWRKLNCERGEFFDNEIKSIYESTRNIPYDINPMDWIKAGLKIDYGNTHKTTTFFCSALCAYIYVKLGLLPTNIPWTIISPQELSSTGDLNNCFILCNLEDDIKIVITK